MNFGELSPEKRVRSHCLGRAFSDPVDSVLGFLVMAPPVPQLFEENLSSPGTRCRFPLASFLVHLSSFFFRIFSLLVHLTGKFRKSQVFW